MLIDTSFGKSLVDAGDTARALEAAGYDGIWTGETQHDPFLTTLLAIQATQHITLGTSVAIAFARTPMDTAYSAHDLAALSRGRFVLGLGSQVKPHIERRFSMPWSEPAARMREYVLALKAIWAAWQDSGPLNFAGDFYTHTLMTPFFSPEPHDYGPPPVYLAGVGPRMTEVAGEVCDGFFFHPFTTRRYLQEVTLPALHRGRSAAGHDGVDGFTVAGPAFTCVGRDDAELTTAIAGTKQQIAFYASTPTYRPVLDLHGWGDLQPELTSLTKQGRWSEMGGTIDDEMLHAFAVVGGPEEVGRGLRDRWGLVADRISLYATYRSDPAVWSAVIDAIRS
ncbi:MAG: LLM class F420-dependent oxidoreductase [Acidimicrobiia bacterium]